MKMPKVPEPKYTIWDDYYSGYTLVPTPEDRYDEIKLFTLDQVLAYGESVRDACAEEREEVRHQSAGHDGVRSGDRNKE